MSTFITKDDYDVSIKDYVLDRVTNFDDDLLNKAENSAIKEVKSYLNARYDTEAIFSATGEDRDDKVVQVVIDIALYELHKRINPRKIPIHRKDSYDIALNWLEEVNAGRVNPPDSPKPEDKSKDYILFNSNPKRTNHLQ